MAILQSVFSVHRVLPGVRTKSSKAQKTSMASRTSTTRQICPVCAKEVKPWPRYPEYVCCKCVKSGLETSEGKRIKFTCDGKFGTGVQGYYSGTRCKYNQQICYVRGVLCYADEAQYFGGLVIQPYRLGHWPKSAPV